MGWPECQDKPLRFLDLSRDGHIRISQKTSPHLESSAFMALHVEWGVVMGALVLCIGGLWGFRPFSIGLQCFLAAKVASRGCH